MPIKIALSPLVSFTDAPFRRLCYRFGADYAITEMLSSDALIRRSPKTLRMLKDIDKEPMTYAQLMGSVPNVMAEAAIIAVDLGARGIDINMGCPEKKVVRQGAGSALMRDPDLAFRIVEAVLKAVDVPVTVKMRLGWSEKELNALPLSIGLQKIGVSSIAIHARTKSQMFRGEPLWRRLRPISDALNIRFMANGDVIDLETLNACLAQSGADGALIGRGAIGMPWIFKHLKASKDVPSQDISIIENKDEILRHLEDINGFYGGKDAIYPLKRHIFRYLKGIKNAKAIRMRLADMESSKEIMAFVKKIKNFFIDT